MASNGNSIIPPPMTTNSRIAKSWKQKIGNKERQFFSDGFRTFHLIEGGSGSIVVDERAKQYYKSDAYKGRKEDAPSLDENELECFLLQTHFDYGSRAWSATFLAEQFDMSLKELAIALIPLIKNGKITTYMTTYRMSDAWLKEIEKQK